jgi:predicted methyltransferase
MTIKRIAAGVMFLIAGGAGRGATGPDDVLRWISPDATVILVFQRPAQGQRLYEDFGAEILFAAGLHEKIEEWIQQPGVRLFRDTEAFAVAVEHDRRGLIVARGALPGAFRLDDTHCAFGDAARGRPGGPALGPWRDSAAISGRFRPDWFGFHFTESTFARADIQGSSVSRSLASIRGAAFSGNVSEDRVDFRMTTDVAGSVESSLAADGLRALLATLRSTARVSAPLEVQQALDGARVHASGTQVELRMSLGASAVARIRRNEGSRAILQWRIDEAERERREPVREILDLAGVTRGSTVADVGASLGFYTVRLAREVGASGRVYAEDIDGKALSQLRERVEEAAFRNVTVVEGQPDDPKLPAGALDAVLIVNSYHEMSRHQEMLVHIRAALRPGGRLVMVEPFAPARRGESRESQEKDHRIAPELVEADLRAAGFEIVLRNEEFIVRGDKTLDWCIAARRPSS